MKLSHILGAAIGTAAVAPVAVCLGRAIANRPTAAANAKIEIKNDDRAVAYGEQLAKMVRCETISSRYDQKVEKFLTFHEVLAELFPNVHAACEKHVFDGSLLFKWASCSSSLSFPAPSPPIFWGSTPSTSPVWRATSATCSSFWADRACKPSGGLLFSTENLLIIFHKNGCKSVGMMVEYGHSLNRQAKEEFPMIKVIMGLKGSGKTKQLINAIQDAVATEAGDIVCIEYGKKLTYDVNYKVRLVDSEEYGIKNVDMLKGLISGLHAGNFDITHVFIDNLYKTIGHNHDFGEEFIAWAAKFCETNNMKITMTVSDDPALASETIKQYL